MDYKNRESLRPRSRRSIQTALNLFALGVAFALTASNAAAQDGRAILQRMASAYKELSSYEGASSVTELFVQNGKSTSLGSASATMKLKRPNRLYLSISTARGSKNIYSDGKNFTVFLPSLNQYLTENTTPDIKAMLPLLLTRGQIIARLDPLYFLSSSELPKELGDIKLLPETKFEGVPVYVVSGVTRTQTRTLKAKDGRSLTLPGATLQWKWWIEKSSNLLRKIELRKAGDELKVQAREGKKVVVKTLKGDRVIRHIIAKLTPNPSIADDTFAFRPPPGASKLKSAQELMGGK